MRFRSRLFILIGVVILGLGIMKPLVQAGYKTLQTVEVFPGGGAQQKCVRECESEPLTFWWSNLFKKKEPPKEKIIYGYDTDQRGKGDGNGWEVKFISLGFHSASKGKDEEGGGSFPYWLIAAGLAGLIGLILIVRRLRKRQKWDKTQDESKPRPIGTKKIFQETKREEELPPLPVEQVRQQVVLFNRQLPQKLKRRETESFREWFERIGFHPSLELQRLYETVRYDPNQSTDVTATVLVDIENDFSKYLGQLK
ncbi:hypothetical protein [Exiguobacterium antarcticum]|uniref:DUF4129 domain-containing protein n=1 Tax=Exiguobacterium antarcticum TaxID=132920 RepID=A0ABT6R126_9BACL|nr:hypothetical protein [Exiguobacterium antarcticum]AFS71837.1 Hypothetical protein Eab7_2756 [Exiguobacterium antarcticum B7]MDI3234647.1 hypothetical protein [Exiguobacterium antarcticum]